MVFYKGNADVVVTDGFVGQYRAEKLGRALLK